MPSRDANHSTLGPPSRPTNSNCHPNPTNPQPMKLNVLQPYQQQPPQMQHPQHIPSFGQKISNKHNNIVMSSPNQTHQLQHEHEDSENKQNYSLVHYPQKSSAAPSAPMQYRQALETQHARELLHKKLQDDYELKRFVVELEEQLAHAQTLLKKTEEYIKTTEDETKALRIEISHTEDQLSLIKENIQMWPAKEQVLKQRLDFYRNNTKLMLERKTAECDEISQKILSYEEQFTEIDKWFNNSLHQRVSAQAKPQLEKIDLLRQKIAQLGPEGNDLNQQKQEIAQLKRQVDDLQFQITTWNASLQNAEQKSAQLDQYPLKLANTLQSQQNKKQSNARQSLTSSPSSIQPRFPFSPIKTNQSPSQQQMESSALLLTAPFDFDSQFLSFSRPAKEIKLPDPVTVSYHLKRLDFGHLIDHFLQPREDPTVTIVKQSPLRQQFSMHTSERAGEHDSPLRDEDGDLVDVTLADSNTVVADETDPISSCSSSQERLFTKKRFNRSGEDDMEDNSSSQKNNSVALNASQMTFFKTNQLIITPTYHLETANPIADANDPLWFLKQDITLFLQPSVNNTTLLCKIPLSTGFEPNDDRNDNSNTNMNDKYAKSPNNVISPHGLPHLNASYTQQSQTTSHLETTRRYSGNNENNRDETNQRDTAEGVEEDDDQLSMDHEQEHDDLQHSSQEEYPLEMDENGQDKVMADQSQYLVQTDPYQLIWDALLDEGHSEALCNALFSERCAAAGLPPLALEMHDSHDHLAQTTDQYLGDMNIDPTSATPTQLNFQIPFQQHQQPPPQTSSKASETFIYGNNCAQTPDNQSTANPWW